MVGVEMMVGDGGALNVGDAVTGEITGIIYAVDYTITLQAGETITVTMEALGDRLDTYLSIFDADGAELAFNDDAAVQVGDTSYNSQIVDFSAPADGTYTIRATRYFQENGSSTGSFQLTVTSVSGDDASADDEK